MERYFYSEQAIADQAAPILDAIKRDSLLEVGGETAAITSAVSSVMVRLKIEGPRTQPTVKPHVVLQSSIEFELPDSAAVSAISYALEIGIGDGDSWRVRVPKRFLETNADRVFQTASRVVNAPGEWQSFNRSGGYSVVKASIVGHDPKQTFMALDEADLSVLTSPVREAFRDAYRQAVAGGFALDTIVQDSADLVERLTRGSFPSTGDGPGFSMS